ncbi:hypothetical protein [Shimia sediminis]|uniref:hypothetical protein n=1 Tax=Shimia sediminis TaxID=2497945 RepID=UPI000F8CC7AB|nr:hypothetical protein [Shimia sediminis]
MRWAVAMLLLSGAAQADPLGANDYAAMFEEYADQVVTDAGGARALERDDGVTVYETIDGDTRLYAGVDFHKGGPVGCLTSFYAETLSFVQACPDLAPTPNPEHLARLLVFYAENAAPPADPAVLKARFDALVAQHSDQITQCVPNSVMIDYAKVLMGEGADELFDTVLATPRLPVTQPCP